MQLIRYIGTLLNAQQWAQSVTAGVHDVSSRVSAGGCGISLDGGSVSKELQLCIVLGKKLILLCSCSTADQSSIGRIRIRMLCLP